MRFFARMRSFASCLTFSTEVLLQEGDRSRCGASAVPLGMCYTAEGAGLQQTSPVPPAAAAAQHQLAALSGFASCSAAVPAAALSAWNWQDTGKHIGSAAAKGRLLPGLGAAAGGAEPPPGRSLGSPGPGRDRDRAIPERGRSGRTEPSPGTRSGAGSAPPPGAEHGALQKGGKRGKGPISPMELYSKENEPLREREKKRRKKKINCCVISRILLVSLHTKLRFSPVREEKKSQPTNQQTPKPVPPLADIAIPAWLAWLEVT